MAHRVEGTMSTPRILFACATLAAALGASLFSGCTPKGDTVAAADKADEKAGLKAPGFTETRAIAEEAYVFGFPMIAGYKALYQFNVDKSSNQYKGPFNTIINDSQVFTYKDTAIVTPNSDTPYSMLQADLRAEPLVICVPAVASPRYYSVQFCDMYSCTYAYVGSRATGTEAGCYLLAGPDWKGETPAGVKGVFRCETQFSLVIFRTQLFNAGDIENVKKVQAGYQVKPLSAFLGKAPPPPAPEIKWLAFNEDLFKTQAPEAIDFLLQFCPEMPGDAAVRAKMASIGIGPKKTFNFKDLSLEHKLEVGEGIKRGFASIEKKRDELGTEINGWAVGSAFGDRAFYNGNYLERAAAALAGIYGNEAAEAMYPMCKADSTGQPLDGSKHNYTLTFPAGAMPPVNAFWSVTMYDGKTQLLIKNPIDRYLINSPMLPGMKKNADGSLTLYVQKSSPGKDKESNWLPAPDGPIYLVMRLYWPKTGSPSILPPGKGTWKPPAVVRAN